MNLLQETAARLRERGFTAEVFVNKDEAKKYILEEAKKARSVGFGGSATLKEMNLPAEVVALGVKVWRHGDPNLTPEEKTFTMVQQQVCGLFLLSANAIAGDGTIINIDGTGNRVAASIYGPDKVIFVVGRNKIVEGGIHEAIRRAREIASVKNYIRFHPEITEEEAREKYDEICKVTVIMDKRPTTTDTTVVLIDEDLGF